MVKKRNIFFFAIILFLLIINFLFIVFAIGLTENNSWEVNLMGIGFSAMAFGDIDNNNHSELILSGCLTATQTNCNMGTITKLYSSNGSSLNVNITLSTNLTNVGWSSVSMGDIDNDGKLDLGLAGCKNATATCNDGPISKIYINNGTALIENITWESNLTGIWDGNLLLADITNDGRLDLILTGNTGSNIITKVYINNGSVLNENLIWEQNLIGVYQGSSLTLDIDSDGYLDLILTGDTSVESKLTRIYKNNGSSFTEWQTLLSVDRSSLAAGDIDNDGLTDLALIGQSGGDHFYIYINNGTAMIQNQTGIGDGGEILLGLYRGSISFGDYDNDGYLDLAAIGKETTRNRIYKNNRTQFIVDSSASIDLQTDDFIQGALAWYDLEGDNNIDLIVSGYSFGDQALATKVYINNITTNNSIPHPPINFSNYILVDGDIFFGWNNGSDDETMSNGLYYNLRVGTSSSGNEIVSGVFGGSSGGGGGGGGANGYFGNMMQRRNISLSGSRFSVGTIYYWSVQTIDTGLAKSAWSTEMTFNLTSDFTPPTITLNAPSSGLVTNQTMIMFNATVVDDYGLMNVSLYGNWSDGWHKNETDSSGINNTAYVFSKNLSEGNWLWGIIACDNTSNCRSSANQTIRIDLTLPVVNLMSPANGTPQTSSNIVTFTYNVSDLAISNCSLLISGVVQRTNTSITINASQTFTEEVSNGDYNWSVRCTDAANNINNSATYALTLSYTAPETPASISGGSGGGGSSTIIATPKVSRIIATIAAGNNLIEFTDAEKISIGVEEILLNVANAAANVKISVEKLSAIPAEIPIAPSANTYSYLKIEKTILKDEDVKNAKINFIIPKNWISMNNYDYQKIILQRYINVTGWEKLPTTFSKQDSTNYYYESTTPGFSVFAITAEKKAEAENIKQDVNESEQEIKEETPAQEPQKSEGVTKAGKKILGHWYALVVLFAAALIVIIIIVKKAKKQK